MGVTVNVKRRELRNILKDSTALDLAAESQVFEVLNLVDLENSKAFDGNRLGDNIICHPNS